VLLITENADRTPLFALSTSRRTIAGSVSLALAIGIAVRAAQHLLDSALLNTCSILCRLLNGLISRGSASSGVRLPGRSSRPQNTQRTNEPPAVQNLRVIRMKPDDTRIRRPERVVRLPTPNRPAALRPTASSLVRAAAPAGGARHALPLGETLAQFVEAEERETLGQSPGRLARRQVLVHGDDQLYTAMISSFFSACSQPVNSVTRTS